MCVLCCETKGCWIEALFCRNRENIAFSQNLYQYLCYVVIRSRFYFVVTEKNLYQSFTEYVCADFSSSIPLLPKD